MKKILIDANPVVPYYVFGHQTGIGRTTLELVQALAKMTDLPFEIELYSQNMKGVGVKNLQLPFSKKHLYMPNRPKWNHWLSKFPVREWLTGYDLMHIPHNYEQVYCPEKCIVTLHDALFMHIQEKRFGHDKMKEIVPPFIRKCHTVITCSEYSKKDIVETMQVSPEKVHVIYWGMNHELFYPREVSLESVCKELNLTLQGDGYFLSVSCNAERKRTHELVDTYIHYAEANDAKNDLVLVWGNPPMDLVERIKQSKVSHRIHFLANITDEKLALLYNGAKAFFFVSMFEGFGLPLIEAMACGTPVVTCRNSSLTEIGEDAALVAQEPIRDSLPTFYKAFDEERIDCKELIQKGIQRASEFTWEKTAKETVEVYKQALGL